MLFEEFLGKAIRKISWPSHADTFSPEIRGTLDVFARQHHIRQPYQRGSDQLCVHSRADAHDVRVGIAVEKIDLIRRQARHRHGAAAHDDVLGVDAVFIEEPIVQRRIEMNKAARDRARADAHFHDRLTGFGEVRIGEHDVHVCTIKENTDG